MTPQGAEAIAAQALAWLAQDEELLPVFLGASGSAPADIRRQADAPEFLGGVLDFVMMDDAWVLGFAAWAERRPEEVAAARQLLPGGETRHWT